MSLDQIVQIQIDRNTTMPTAMGFGTPLLLGSFPSSVFPERVRTFSSLQDLLDVGLKSFDPVYIMASDMLAQNPTVTEFKVGRRTHYPTQTITLTPTDFTVGKVYTVTVRGHNNATRASRVETTNTATYTVVGGDTATTVCNGLRTSFGSQTGDFSDTGSATLILTALNTHATVDGEVFGVETSSGFTISDGTSNPGIETDLAEIAAEDNDWYGLCIDSNSAAEIQAAATWVASNKKIFVAQTQDTPVASTSAVSDTTSLAYLLKAGNQERTMLFYHKNNRDYVSAGMLGRALPEDAGSITYAYKQLGNVTANVLTTNEQTNLRDKSVNFYNTVAGVNVTRWGTTMSSGGEYMDVINGSDWLAARIQERVYALLIQNDKLPFTDAGIQAVRSEILAQLQQGIARNFIAADPEPTCTVPRASEVAVADKAARLLTGVTFRATLAGAIHKTEIVGELNL
jgi:hypothetical protein